MNNLWIGYNVVKLFIFTGNRKEHDILQHQNYKCYFLLGNVTVKLGSPKNNHNTPNQA
jgi:hypothetical protein